MRNFEVHAEISDCTSENGSDIIEIYSETQEEICQISVFAGKCMHVS